MVARLAYRRTARVLPLLLAPLLVLVAGCGAGDTERESSAASSTPVSVGAGGEIDDAPYIAYERVTLERLPRARVERAEEIRFAQQVRRAPAYRLRDGGDSAIRYTEDGARGWLAWQPSIVLRVRREFAQAEGGQPSAVTTLGVARVQWPDGCLGISLPGRSCGREPAAGFRVTVRLGGTTAVFHTNLREQVQRAPA